MVLLDYRITLFTNFGLSILEQHFNTDMVEKWTQIPPVSPQNYKLTTKEALIKQ